MFCQPLKLVSFFSPSAVIEVMPVAPMQTSLSAAYSPKQEPNVGVKVALFGIPALSTFRKIGCKTQLNFDPKVPLPHSVQCGRDLSAFIKAGEIPEGVLDITAKIPTFSDGLSRVNGRRVTGMIKEVKEDVLDTMHVFLMGLIMSAKATAGESVDAATLTATAKYEDICILLAQ